jgi:cytochrome P450
MTERLVIFKPAAPQPEVAVVTAPTTPQGPAVANPLQNPALLANPYPFYAALRANNPVFRVPAPIETGAGIFLLTRHADVEAVLRDADHAFSVRRGEADVFRLYADRLPTTLLEGPGGAQSMLMQDPPAHTRLRGLVSKAFTPRRIAELAPRIETQVDALLSEVLSRGEADWIHDLAEPLPAIVIAELLGVPPEDHRTFRQWSSRLIDSLPSFGQGSSSDAEESVGVILGYLREQIAQRRTDPRDDLISALIAAQEEQDALSEQELVSTAFLLLLAGHETTTNLIGNGLLALLRNPEAWTVLRGHPERADQAVEELLRYDSPVQGTVRIPTRDVGVGAQTIGRGALVVCGIGAANRDPEVHPEPDRLDLQRDPIRHLSFGFGTHFCLGAALARLEGVSVFRALAERVSSIAALRETLQYRANPVLRGLRSLPVKLA